MIRKISGFTLVEILVAVSILGLILTAILGTFTGIIRGARIGEDSIELYQSAMAVMDIISSDIRGMYNPYNLEEGFPFRGYSEVLEEKEVSGMEFVTTNKLSIEESPETSLEEISYHVKKNEKDNLYSLWRRAQSPPQTPLEEGGKEVPICRIVENFQLTFLKNNTRMKNLEYQVPDAIEIRFTLNFNGQKESFVTMVKPMIETH